MPPGKVLGMDLGKPGGDLTAVVESHGQRILSVKYITFPPDTDGAGLPIRTYFSLTCRRGPKLLRFLRDEHGAEALIPDYLPNEWLNRIRLEVDDQGKPHFLWTGWNNGEGHAKVRRDGKAIYCHRDIVERVEGRKLTRWNYVDHKCERKSCLNYDCLEAVPPGENTRRGPGAQHQFKPAAAYLDTTPSPGTEWVRDRFLGEPLDGL